MKFPIVGLSGVARAGKSYVGKLISDKFSLVPYALAYPIKYRTYALNTTWSLSQILGDDDKPDDLRKFLQEEGTERGRDLYGEDIWTRHAEAFLFTAKYDMGFSGVVITDVRFPNECSWVHDMGGLVLRVERDGAGLSGEYAQHRSESYINQLDVDGVIDNTGYRDDTDLFDQVYPYMKMLGV